MRAWKLSTALLFVCMLTIPTIFGAIPLSIYTPKASVSLAVPEAEARNRNTSNNRLRSLRVPTNRVSFTRSFSANRHSYTINLRENISRIVIQPTRGNNNQSIRFRQDARASRSSSWNNGRWTSWNRANTRVTLSGIRAGEERRLRIAVRDNNRNVRTYTVNIRRASNNTFLRGISITPRLYADRGFHRNATTYNVPIPRGANNPRLQAFTDHPNAQVRSRVGNGSWSSYRRGDRAVTPTVAQGSTVRVQFQVRGAWSNLAASPTRTRTYTVNFSRPLYRQLALEEARIIVEEYVHSRESMILALMQNTPNRRFSRADATFAADNVGENWYDNAIEVAVGRWFESPSTSRAQLVHELVNFYLFTQSQANHAANLIFGPASLSEDLRLDSEEIKAAFDEVPDMRKLPNKEELETP